MQCTRSLYVLNQSTCLGAFRSGLALPNLVLLQCSVQHMPVARAISYGCLQSGGQPMRCSALFRHGSVEKAKLLHRALYDCVSVA